MISNNAELVCLFARNPDHHLQTPLNILFRRRPRRNTDAHGRAAAPDSRTTPARVVLLNSDNDLARHFGIAERNRHLVERNLIQHLMTRSLQAQGQLRNVIVTSFA